MASTSNSKPTRGILKTSKSDQLAAPTRPDVHKSKEAAHFDEMNILATYHPPDKDYGHMKIDEPKTPYRHDHDHDDESQAIDPEELAQRLTTSDKTSRTRTISTDEDDDDKYMTPQALEKKKNFETARKKHYNMKEEIRKAKELLAKEMAEDDDD